MIAALENVDVPRLVLWLVSAQRIGQAGWRTLNRLWTLSSSGVSISCSSAYNGSGQPEWASLLHMAIGPTPRPSFSRNSPFSAAPHIEHASGGSATSSPPQLCEATVLSQYLAFRNGLKFPSPDGDPMPGRMPRRDRVVGGLLRNLCVSPRLCLIAPPLMEGARVMVQQ